MLKLYSYWRSSASYRVRIALNLKQLPYEIVPIHLVRDGGEQHGTAYRALNPQQRVPLLVDGDFHLQQSLAIIDYLDARLPQPRLIPLDPQRRARVLAFAMAVIADIQPLQNTGTLRYLQDELGLSDTARGDWLRHFIGTTLRALEVERADAPDTPFVFGDEPTLADCVLVPQLYAALRFGCDAEQFPRLARIAAHCESLPAFALAHPSRQPDAE
ncbi:maleylacetoacetate isomerase [Solimonas marina]|uniref:Maleylacetoacetate isomerase n=1 Tax=Solimonas marina TaxID=2714601 RepID=A0A969W8R0_9GAMM|nr:maleylacetoacetate isomerase [Solimonas marina]NKF22063.1 maleylacetoacetate isomerase [Solimonas marina]